MFRMGLQTGKVNLPENGRNFFTLKISTTNLKNTTNS
jgi:hypothetical protein